jgi:cytosine/adenosine deaminase-related metal-dependent hydrolase
LYRRGDEGQLDYSLVIRSLAVITEPAGRRNWRQIDDGAVLHRDGVIAEIGPFAELSARHRDGSVIGIGQAGGAAGVRQR